MRNRLPEPKPRIGTLIPVRPSRRWGNLLEGTEPKAGTVTSPTATASRNCRRFIRRCQARATRRQAQVKRLTHAGEVRIRSSAHFEEPGKDDPGVGELCAPAP